MNLWELIGRPRRVVRLKFLPCMSVEEVGKFFGEKNIAFGWKDFPSIKNGTPPTFVKPLDLTSGSSMSSMVNLILVRKGLNCFNFYSIYFKQGLLVLYL